MASPAIWGMGRIACEMNGMRDAGGHGTPSLSWLIAAISHFFCVFLIVIQYIRFYYPYLRMPSCSYSPSTHNVECESGYAAAVPNIEVF